MAGLARTEIKMVYYIFRDNPLQADFQAVSLLWEANKVCQAWCDSEGNDEYSRVKKMNIFRPACHRPASSSEYSYQEQSKGIFCRLDT